ncbi:MAG: hypothetical protein K6A44_06150 [bacterium]|nr:hypothetical protein [bacterium]
MKKLLAAIGLLCISSTVFARDVAVEPSYIYDQILDASNYEIIDYNYPAGSRELNLFGLRSQGQYNINAVASPDFNMLVYSEVYFYPDPRVTASALYIVPLDSNLSNREAILSVSTKDKLPNPIIETDYAKLYPMKFDTYTPVDWNQNSDKILFKEKIGENYDKIYMTKLYLYDMASEHIYDLNIVRTSIIDFWTNKGIFLNDYKWDIKPLGFEVGSDKVIVQAYGYYKNERRNLGLWAVDYRGQNAYMLSLDENYRINISANGKCLKFIPDMGDIFAKQRRIDSDTKSIYIEPK